MIDVLLIDDDLNESKLLDCYLHLQFGEDYSFSHAPDLNKAVDYLEDRKFDVVFLDNRLEPGADFRTTIPRLGNLLENTKLFLISAEVDDRKFKMTPPSVNGVIDKFLLRQEIEAGLLG